MRKKLLVTLLVAFTYFVWSQQADQVAKLGDAEWEKIISDNKKNNMFIENVKASQLVKNFSKNKGKLMMFPSFDFTQFVTDSRNSEKYYYSGDPNSFDLYVIKYNDGIQDKFRMSSYIFGNMSGAKWEVIGRLTEAYDWWGNVIVMEIVAMRAPGKCCVVINDGKAVFIGQDIVDVLMKEKSKDPYSDVPKDLKSIPKGLDPLIVAKLYFYTSSVMGNRQLWEQLLTKEFKASEAKKNSLWGMITKNNRSFYYIRTAEDTPTQKRYIFQMQENGQDIGSPKPAVVNFEDGEWKFQSF